MTAQLTMLNSMAAADFDESLRVHREWNLHWLDLRDEIYGKWVKDLTVDDAKRARAAIDESGLEVFCLSTSIFFDDIAKGEEHFREVHIGQLRRSIEVARQLRPSVFRLIAAQLPERGDAESAIELIERRHPWLIDVYRDAIDLVTDAGLTPTIENEAFRCFLSDTDDFVRFFDVLDRPDTSLTWDINNQWATGVFPTLADYERLRPLIGYYHVKGGQFGGEGDRLAWNSTLEDSDWPVVEITQRVVDDGVSPVICLNPSQHGEQKPGYDYTDIVKRDVDYLRAAIEGIE